MKILFIVACILTGMAAFVILILHIRTRKPLRSVLLHAALGLGFLVAVNLLSRFTGVSIPVNAYSTVSSAVFGIPAVCGYLILNLIL